MCIECPRPQTQSPHPLSPCDPQPTRAPARPARTSVAPTACAPTPLRAARSSTALPPVTARRVVAARASAMKSDAKLTVVVTGAGGKTGGLVVDQLAAAGDAYEVRPVARGPKKGAPLPVTQIDVTAADAADKLASVLAGADALVIATSAVPKIQKRSLVKMMLAKLVKKQGVRPTFTWKGGQPPVEVDWRGQKVQIDAAKAAGVKRVVLVSSMGVTQPDNMLNSIGDGKILLYKRKAEEYLVASGLEYAIIHPGGLIDAPGGEREVVLGVDDALLAGTVRSIPRADVASLTVACLTAPEAAAVSLDCVAKPPGEGAPTTDYRALLAGLGGKTAAYAPLPESARV